MRTQEPCELVVVDDGSTDERTLEVVRQLEHDGVPIVRQENAGVAAARMAGVRATSAPYVYALDADDELAPGALADLADALDRDPEAVAAWGDVESFGTASVYHTPSRTLDPWRITYLNDLPGTSLFRRRSLLEVGGWQLRDGYEDWDLWMAFAERGWHGVYVPRLMFRYRRHDEPRLWRAAAAAHERRYAELRRRHRALFERRVENRRRSRTAWPLKVLLPVVDALPGVSRGLKQRIFHVANDPRAWLAFRRSRRRRR